MVSTIFLLFLWKVIYLFGENMYAIGNSVFGRRLREQEEVEAMDNAAHAGSVYTHKKWDPNEVERYGRRKSAAKEALMYLTEREKEETGGDWDYSRRKLEVRRASTYLSDKEQREAKKRATKERKAKREIGRELQRIEDEKIKKVALAAEKRELMRQREEEMQRYREFLMNKNNYDDRGLVWPPPGRRNSPPRLNSLDDGYIASGSDEDLRRSRQAYQSMYSSQENDDGIEQEPVGHLRRALMKAGDPTLEIQRLPPRPEPPKPEKSPEHSPELQTYGVQVLPYDCAVASAPTAEDCLVPLEGGESDDYNGSDEERRVRFGTKLVSDEYGIRLAQLERQRCQKPNKEGILKPPQVEKKDKNNSFGGARPKSKYTVQEMYTQKYGAKGKKRTKKPEDRRTRGDPRGQENPGFSGNGQWEPRQSKKERRAAAKRNLGKMDPSQLGAELGLDLLTAKPEELEMRERFLKNQQSVVGGDNPSGIYTDLRQRFQAGRGKVTVEVHKSEDSEDYVSSEEEETTKTKFGTRNVTVKPGDLDYDLKAVRRQFLVGRKKSTFEDGHDQEDFDQVIADKLKEEEEERQKQMTDIQKELLEKRLQRKQSMLKVLESAPDLNKEAVADLEGADKACPSSVRPGESAYLYAITPDQTPNEWHKADSSEKTSYEPLRLDSEASKLAERLKTGMPLEMALLDEEELVRRRREQERIRDGEIMERSPSPETTRGLSYPSTPYGYGARSDGDISPEGASPSEEFPPSPGPSNYSHHSATLEQQREGGISKTGTARSMYSISSKVSFDNRTPLRGGSLRSRASDYSMSSSNRIKTREHIHRDSLHDFPSGPLSALCCGSLRSRRPNIPPELRKMMSLDKAPKIKTPDILKYLSSEVKSPTRTKRTSMTKSIPKSSTVIPIAPPRRSKRRSSSMSAAQRNAELVKRAQAEKKEKMLVRQRSSTVDDKLHQACARERDTKGGRGREEKRPDASFGRPRKREQSRSIERRKTGEGRGRSSERKMTSKNPTPGTSCKVVVSKSDGDIKSKLKPGSIREGVVLDVNAPFPVPPPRRARSRAASKQRTAVTSANKTVPHSVPKTKAKSSTAQTEDRKGSDGDEASRAPTLGIHTGVSQYYNFDTDLMQSSRESVCQNREVAPSDAVFSLQAKGDELDSESRLVNGASDGEVCSRVLVQPSPKKKRQIDTSLGSLKLELDEPDSAFLSPSSATSPDLSPMSPELPGSPKDFPTRPPRRSKLKKQRAFERDPSSLGSTGEEGKSTTSATPELSPRVKHRLVVDQHHTDYSTDTEASAAPATMGHVYADIIEKPPTSSNKNNTRLAAVSPPPNRAFGLVIKSDNGTKEVSKMIDEITKKTVTSHKQVGYSSVQVSPQVSQASQPLVRRQSLDDLSDQGQFNEAYETDGSMTDASRDGVYSLPRVDKEDLALVSETSGKESSAPSSPPGPRPKPRPRRKRSKQASKDAAKAPETLTDICTQMEDMVHVLEREEADHRRAKEALKATENDLESEPFKTRPPKEIDKHHAGEQPEKRPPRDIIPPTSELTPLLLVQVPPPESIPKGQFEGDVLLHPTIESKPVIRVGPAIDRRLRKGIVFKGPDQVEKDKDGTPQRGQRDISPKHLDIQPATGTTPPSADKPQTLDSRPDDSRVLSHEPIESQYKSVDLSNIIQPSEEVTIDSKTHTKQFGIADESEARPKPLTKDIISAPHSPTDDGDIPLIDDGEPEEVPTDTLPQIQTLPEQQQIQVKKSDDQIQSSSKVTRKATLATAESLDSKAEGEQDEYEETKETQKDKKTIIESESKERLRDQEPEADTDHTGEGSTPDESFLAESFEGSLQSDQLSVDLTGSDGIKPHMKPPYTLWGEDSWMRGYPDRPEHHPHFPNHTPPLVDRHPFDHCPTGDSISSESLGSRASDTKSLGTKSQESLGGKEESKLAIIESGSTNDIVNTGRDHSQGGVETGKKDGEEKKPDEVSSVGLSADKVIDQDEKLVSDEGTDQDQILKDDAVSVEKHEVLEGKPILESDVKEADIKDKPSESEVISPLTSISTLQDDQSLTSTSAETEEPKVEASLEGKPSAEEKSDFSDTKDDSSTENYTKSFEKSESDSSGIKSLGESVSAPETSRSEQRRSSGEISESLRSSTDQQQESGETDKLVADTEELSLEKEESELMGEPSPAASVLLEQCEENIQSETQGDPTAKAGEYEPSSETSGEKPEFEGRGEAEVSDQPDADHDVTTPEGELEDWTLEKQSVDMIYSDGSEKLSDQLYDSPSSKLESVKSEEQENSDMGAMSLELNVSIDMEGSLSPDEEQELEEQGEQDQEEGVEECEASFGEETEEQSDKQSITEISSREAQSVKSLPPTESELKSRNEISEGNREEASPSAIKTDDDIPQEERLEGEIGEKEGGLLSGGDDRMLVSESSDLALSIDLPGEEQLASSPPPPEQDITCPSSGTTASEEAVKPLLEGKKDIETERGPDVKDEVSLECARDNIAADTSKLPDTTGGQLEEAPDLQSSRDDGIDPELKESLLVESPSRNDGIVHKEPEPELLKDGPSEPTPSDEASATNGQIGTEPPVEVVTKDGSGEGDGHLPASDDMKDISQLPILKISTSPGEVGEGQPPVEGSVRLGPQEHNVEFGNYAVSSVVDDITSEVYKDTLEKILSTPLKTLAESMKLSETLQEEQEEKNSDQTLESVCTDDNEQHDEQKGQINQSDIVRDETVGEDQIPSIESPQQLTQAGEASPDSDVKNGIEKDIEEGLGAEIFPTGESLDQADTHGEEDKGDLSIETQTDVIPTTEACTETEHIAGDSRELREGGLEIGDHGNLMKEKEDEDTLETIDNLVSQTDLSPCDKGIDTKLHTLLKGTGTDEVTEPQSVSEHCEQDAGTETCSSTEAVLLDSTGAMSVTVPQQAEDDSTRGPQPVVDKVEGTETGLVSDKTGEETDKEAKSISELTDHEAVTEF